MILTCPECGTQYMVKDGAIPAQGRQVRCAACKHSWHQEAESGPEEAPREETLAEATMIEPRSGPEAEERAFEAAVVEGGDAADSEPADDEPPQPAEPYSPSEMGPAEAAFDQPDQQPLKQPVDHRDMDPELPVAAPPAADWNAPPDPEAQADVFSPFAEDEEPEQARRGPLVKILLVVLVVAALAAAFWFLAPAEIKARIGLGGAQSSPLALVTTHMDRQKLESGNELLTVAGRVINPTQQDQSVPPLQAELKTKAGQTVYSWTIAPPARNLAPGASAAFNSTEIDVPPGGEELTITLGSKQA